VYKHKHSLNNKILQYKSKWVIRGFKQQKSFNYYKTFVLIIKPISYKLLFAITIVNDFKIEQMDIKMAFLYSNINTKIYIKQPEGIGAIKKLHKVYKLNKAFYSLKQLLHI